MKKFISYKHSLIFLSICIFSFLFCLTACEQRKENKKAKAQQTIMTVSMHETAKKLYFSGLVESLKKVPVITPSKGTVKSSFFDFGTKVKKGTLLFTIDTAQKRIEYEETLTNYFKEKQKFNTSKTQAETSEKLYKQGIISRDEHDQAQNNYSLDKLSFVQSEKKLKNLLNEQQFETVKKLSLQNLNAVIKALETGAEAVDIVKIHAPVSGIILSSKDDKTQPGTELKEGEVLLYLGDMSGISTRIKVTEININQLSQGQKATLTSSINPNIVLDGNVKSINLQAEANGGLPSFSAEIVVPKLSAEHQKIIHTGMSVKVEITLQQKKQILVPIKAVFQSDDGTNYVKKTDEKGKIITKTTVTTGETTENSVAITSGLKVGDHIIVPN